MDVTALGVELPWLHPAMNGNLLEAMAINPNETAVPADPDFSAEVFRWDRVIRFGDFHMCVPVYLALAFVVKRKRFRWQRLQRRSLNLLEHLANLLLCCAVDTCVCNRSFPVSKETILLGERLKDPSLKRVGFHIFDAALDFTFVPCHVGLSREDDEAVVSGKGGDFGIEFWVEPIGILDGGF